MQTAGEPELSLIVPLHDEAENLPAFLAKALPALEQTGREFEIILIDDGSRDGTLSEIRAACARDPRVVGVALRRCFGKGAALAAGIERARGARIATMDGDLQEDPAEIRDLLQGLDEGFDLVSGWRLDRKDSALKRLSSLLFNLALRVLTGLDLHDINCGFKVMTRTVAQDLLLTGGRFRFMPVLAHWLGYRVTERGVSHRARARGRSHYGIERLGSAFIDLVALLSLIRYHSRPGSLFISAGALSTLAGLGICVHIVCIYVGYGNIQSRHPYLILGVLLIIIGVQLVATGFLGEWLAFRYRRGEPDYRVRWQSGPVQAPPARTERAP